MDHFIAHANNIGQTSDFGWMPMHHGWGMMGDSWLGGAFGILISLLAILFLIVLIRWLWIKGDQEKGSKGE